MLNLPFRSLVLLFFLIACKPQQNEETGSMDAQLFYKINAQLGEGPIWNHQTEELYWVDIEDSLLHILNPSTREDRAIATPSRIGTVVPIDSTGAMVALQDGTYIMDLADSSLTPHVYIDSATQDTRLNDGKCDPAGRLWVGSMDMLVTKPIGSLYMVDNKRNLTHQLDSITVSNGIVWSLDGKNLYYIDTPTQRIDALDYDNSTGAISNRRSVVQIPAECGSPDGMTIDEEGMLWVGMWNGSAVLRFDPNTGELLTKVNVPALNVTACAFGGENLDSLFITTARVGTSEEQLQKYPDAGSVFVVVPGVKGVKSTFFNTQSN